MLGLGPTELIIIFVIVLVIFGVGKLPQIGDGLGKAIKGYKKAIDEDDLIDVTPKKIKRGRDKGGCKKGAVTGNSSPQRRTPLFQTGRSLPQRDFSLPCLLLFP